MNEDMQLAAMMDLAEELGVEIRRVVNTGEPTEHPGGAVIRLKGNAIIFLDPTAAKGDQIAVLAAALAGRTELADRFLPPEIRALLDNPQAD